MKKKLLKKLHVEIGVTPLTQSLNFGYPSKEMGKLLKMKPIFFVGLYKNETVGLFWDIDYWTKIAKIITKKAEVELNFFNKLVTDADKLKDKTIELLHQYGSRDFNKISNQNLAIILKELSHNAFMLSVYSQLGQIADISHNVFTSTLEKVIQTAPGFKKHELSVGEIFNILTTSTKFLPSDQANIELKVIKVKLKKDSKRKDIIDEYLSRWHWLNFGHLGPAMTQKQVINQIHKPLLLKKIKDLLIKQEEIQKQLNLTIKQIKMFNVARIFVYLKGMREQICNGVYAFLNRSAEMIQNETGIEKKYLMYLSNQECLDYLVSKKLPSRATLIKRRQSSVWIPQDVFNTEILVGQPAKQYLEKYTQLKEGKIFATSKLSGSVAYPGKVTGRVRIINKVSEINKIKKGEILVSIQTMPELLPAMKKASAIVTDVGGITCHAAIVSREMRIPCVIGTRFATKILKDGQKVEVDATKGIVKKLK